MPHGDVCQSERGRGADRVTHYPVVDVIQPLHVLPVIDSAAMQRDVESAKSYAYVLRLVRFNGVAECRRFDRLFDRKSDGECPRCAADEREAGNKLTTVKHDGLLSRGYDQHSRGTVSKQLEKEN